MSEYNIDYLLSKLESKLENFENNFNVLQRDVKEIQGGMANLGQLGQLIERMSDVETKANDTMIEMVQLKGEFLHFKEMIDRDRIGVKDMFKSVGAVIGWIIALVSSFFAIK